jgi:hypothetical protein
MHNADRPSVLIGWRGLQYFLGRIDEEHHHVSSSVPEMKPPSCIYNLSMVPRIARIEASTLHALLHHILRAVFVAQTRSTMYSTSR